MKWHPVTFEGPMSGARDDGTGSGVSGGQRRRSTDRTRGRSGSGFETEGMQAVTGKRQDQEISEGRFRRPSITVTSQIPPRISPSGSSLSRVREVFSVRAISVTFRAALFHLCSHFPNSK